MPRSIIGIAAPVGLSAVILYILVTFIQQEGGPSITTLYIFSLLIAGGYFFLSAILLYIIRRLDGDFRGVGDELDTLEWKVDRLERIKKDLKEKYYRRDIDPETFKRQMEEVDKKLTYRKEELAVAKEETEQG